MILGSTSNLSRTLLVLCTKVIAHSLSPLLRRCERSHRIPGCVYERVGRGLEQTVTTAAVVAEVYERGTITDGTITDGGEKYREVYIAKTAAGSSIVSFRCSFARKVGFFATKKKSAVC